MAILFKICFQYTSIEIYLFYKQIFYETNNAIIMKQDCPPLKTKMKRPHTYL